MSGEQFPMFRLATLLARRLNAPIAARIKRYARRHPAFQREVCVRLGRAQGSVDARCRLWALRLPQPAAPPPLSEAAALDAGADLLGELVLFSLGAGIVVFEVNRQAKNQEAQKLAKVSQRLAVRLQLQELAAELQQQDLDLQRLHRLLLAAAAERRRHRAGDEDHDHYEDERR